MADVDLKVWADERYRCRTDLWYLATEILGYKDLAQCHIDLVRWEAQTRGSHFKRLTLFPRGHFKSTILNCALTIQDILRTHGIGSTGQEWCIAIFSYDDEQASKFLSEIKQHLEGNEKLKMLFPDVLFEKPQSQALTWKNAAISVIREKAARKEPTVSSYSIMKIPTGAHFDKLVLDDIVTKENAASSAMTKTVTENASFLLPLKVRPDDPEMHIGTPYHMLDFNMGLKRRRDTDLKRGLEPDVAVYFCPAIVDEKPIFPERFTMGQFEAMKRHDPDVFASQYMLDPKVTSKKSIDPELFKNYAPHHIKNRNFRIVSMFVDPARSQNDHSDYSACVVIGMSGRRIYLLDGFYERIDPASMCDRIKRLQKKWNPSLFVVEENGLESYLRIAMETYGVIGWGPFRSKGRKEDRIQAIIPLAKRGRIFLSEKPIIHTDTDGRDYDLTKKLYEEIIEYPYGRHDDLLDALQGAIRIAGVFEERVIDEEMEKHEVHTHEQMARWEMSHGELFSSDESGGDPVYGDYSTRF